MAADLSRVQNREWASDSIRLETDRIRPLPPAPLPDDLRRYRARTGAGLLGAEHRRTHSACLALRARSDTTGDALDIRSRSRRAAPDEGDPRALSARRGPPTAASCRNETRSRLAPSRRTGSLNTALGRDSWRVPFGVESIVGCSATRSRTASQSPDRNRRGLRGRGVIQSVGGAPAVATGRNRTAMVRRGSTVRVRQRALGKAP